MPPPPHQVDEAPPFPEHLQGAIQGLRSALIDLLASVAADPGKPQDLARQFGLNKNLTWKISKIVTGGEPYAVVPHVPGSAGMEIFLRALERAGAPDANVAAVRTAATRFEHVVEVHTGDRSTLEIMVSGLMPVATQSEHHVSMRKLAYQGNSGTWGVRAETQLSLNIMAPNAAAPDQVDVAQIAGLVDFRRLRQDARWLLFRRESWRDDDDFGGSSVESIDPEYPSGVPLLGEFCSKPIPSIHLISDDVDDQYELPPGPVGNTAALTCIYGDIARRLGPSYAERHGEFSEIGCNLMTPAEHLLLDLLVHRDYEWAMSPELIVYSRMDGGAIGAAARRQRNALPVAEPVRDLGIGITALATPRHPNYTRLATHVFERTGWDPNDFRAFRIELAFPPIPTTILFRSELPVRD